MTFGSALGVTGALDVGAALSVTTGGASITGNSVITGTLDVTEDARFRKTLIVDETVACGNVLLRGGTHNDVICDVLDVATNATVRGTLFTQGNMVMNLHTRASSHLKMVVEPFNTLMSHNEISVDETTPSSDMDGIRMKFQEHHPSGTITGSFIAYQGIDHGGVKNGLSLGGYHKTSGGVDNMYPHMKLYSDTHPGTVKIFVPTVFGGVVDFSKDGEQVAWKFLASPSDNVSNGVTSNGTLKVVKKLLITGDFPAANYTSYIIRGGDHGLTTSNRILSAIVWSQSSANPSEQVQNTYLPNRITFDTGSGITSRDIKITFQASRQGQPFSCYIEYY